MVVNAEHINKLVQIYNWTNGAELGVRRGDFSEYLLKNNPNLNMTCVDVWATDPSLNELHNHKQNYDIFLEKMLPFKNRVTEYKMLTTKAAHQVSDKLFDFVFVDATHTYKAVKEDCKLWIPKLKDTGMLCGHDYCEAFDNGGIIKAANELGKFEVLPRGNNDLCNVDKVIDLLKQDKNVADSQTGCWFIWKRNINEN